MFRGHDVDSDVLILCLLVDLSDIPTSVVCKFMSAA